MKIVRVILAGILFLATAAHSQTNTLTDAEIQGRALAQRILAQQPAESFTNTGVMEIRGSKGVRVSIPIVFETSVTETNWQTDYSAHLTNEIAGDQTFGRAYYSWLSVIHAPGQANVYRIPNVNPPPTDTNQFYYLIGEEISRSFSKSDFWLCDLGLEFFHWPEQKVLKKDIHRSCGCIILESTNPNPGTNGYSRVMSWIDTDSLGIVEAYAYDRNGKQLKDFYPDKVKKVNGQWQVQTLVMENVQTGSKSRIEFDLKK